ncbi:MAG: CPBP family intramembrane glutamic endopeptidase [Armatimonadota bacterium]
MIAQERTQSDAKWLTPVEASLLVLAAYFLGTGVLHGIFADPESIGSWLLVSVIPPLVLLAGAIVVRRIASDLYPITSRRRWVSMASVGALAFGAAGGIWIGPTLPERLAPLLAVEWAGLWGLIWVGIGAPIIEELFFRGALQPAVERRLGGVAAIVASTLAFGFAHWGIPEVTIITGVGLVAAIFAWATGHVLPAIALHIGWNFATVAVSYLDYELAAGWPVTLLVVIGVLCLAAARQFRGAEATQ